MLENLPKMPGFYIKNITMKAICNASVRMFDELVKAYVVNKLSLKISRMLSFRDLANTFRYQIINQII